MHPILLIISTLKKKRNELKLKSNVLIFKLIFNVALPKIVPVNQVKL